MSHPAHNRLFGRIFTVYRAKQTVSKHCACVYVRVRDGWCCEWKVQCGELKESGQRPLTIQMQSAALCQYIRAPLCGHWSSNWSTAWPIGHPCFSTPTATDQNWSFSPKGWQQWIASVVGGKIKETGQRLLTTHTRKRTLWHCANTHTTLCGYRLNTGPNGGLSSRWSSDRLSPISQ